MGDAGSLYLLLYILVGVVFIAFGVPLKQGRIKPNLFIGFRTQKTLSDEGLWYSVNRAIGGDMILSGVAIVVSVLFTFALRSWISTTASLVIVTAVTLGCVVFMSVRGFAILKNCR